MTEERPLVDRSAASPPPSDLITKPGPRRPIATIVVVVAISVLFTGIVTGRIDPSSGGRDAGGYGPATGSDASPDRWTPAATTYFRGDGWDGNLVSNGSRVFLMTREDIQGFWGVLRVRWSDDAGVTWSDPVLVSSGTVPDAARHVLAIEPDGTIWAAWAQRGPQESTQRLMLRRSRDDGLTWDPPTRVTGDDVGQVGVPSLVMTPAQRFAAYTDAQTGGMFVQPLDATGAASGSPAFLYVTGRQLYTDEPFLDGGLAATAMGPVAVIATHGGDHVSVKVTEDQVISHGTAYVDDPTWAAPRLATDGSHVVSGVGTRDGPQAHVIVSTSVDGAETWSEAGRWDGPGAGDLSLALSPSTTIAVWQACRAKCAVTDLRVADVASMATGGRTIERTDRSRPVGAVIVGSTLVVAWVREGPSGHTGERVLTVASGPLP